MLVTRGHWRGGEEVGLALGVRQQTQPWSRRPGETLRGLELGGVGRRLVRQTGKRMLLFAIQPIREEGKELASAPTPSHQGALRAEVTVSNQRGLLQTESGLHQHTQALTPAALPGGPSCSPNVACATSPPLLPTILAFYNRCFVNCTPI